MRGLLQAMRVARAGAVAGGGGAVINAASPSYADVAYAVGLAAPGDTVMVPAGDGSETWTGTLTLTRGIHLSGPGRDALTLARAGTLISIEPSATALANNETFRVTGLTLDGNGASATLLGVSCGTTTALRRLAIGDCRFDDTTGTAVYCEGLTFGCVYSNLFRDCSIVLRGLGGQDYANYTNFPYAPGSADNLYFEDNAVSFTKNLGWQGWVEGGQAGRYTLRFNAWDLTNTNDSGLWDMHGNQNGGYVGGEVYGNIVTNSTNGGSGVDYRGGQLICFNNRISGSAGGSFVTRWEYADSDGVIVHPHNGYFFNNWFGSTRKDTQIVTDGAWVNGLVENTDFWNYATSFNGSVGIGIGSSAPSGSNTAGVGYWVTSYSPGTTPPTTLADMRTYCQAGRLYRGNGGTSWSLYFTPYTYPHPLRG